MLQRELDFDKSLSNPWEAHCNCLGSGGSGVFSRMMMMFHHHRCLVDFFTESLRAAVHIGFIWAKRFQDCPGYLVPWPS